jgi:hypothetical protein
LHAFRPVVATPQRPDDFAFPLDQKTDWTAHAIYFPGGSI